MQSTCLALSLLSLVNKTRTACMSESFAKTVSIGPVWLAYLYPEARRFAQTVIEHTQDHRVAASEHPGEFTLNICIARESPGRRPVGRQLYTPGLP